MSLADTKTYARIADRKVAEWPVHARHIAARGLPQRLFQPVRPTGQPLFDPLRQTCAEVRPIVNDAGQPVQQWEVRALPIEAQRDMATAAMRDWIDAFLSRFTDGVPSAEIASWPTKAEAASAYLAGAATELQTEMLAGEAAPLGLTPEDVATVIAAKAAVYQRVIGLTTGMRRATEARIAASDDPWAVLDAAKQAALEKSTELGVA
ncbi:hypothetical protein [Phaeobacter piscinae]|uniref:hypothetical protein n=1 Tax=Phaeobacter piscinae TaxID=1580596 RepID=UPI00058C53D7|nr:hypothetical protein [Phaeobacter piscinae]UTS79571.1 hypothetical protein OL67_000618 [Phaeobacter piscinae]